MVRHRHDSGFTMAEMLIVLALFIFMAGMLPLVKGNHHTMNMKTAALKERLLFIQGRAMREMNDIRVDFKGTRLISDVLTTDIGMRCEGFVIFHANGNVDKAKTIHCRYLNHSSELVLQLGSGRMYVKK